MSEAVTGPRRALTMEDVAREAGVSRATVSLVYRGAKGPSAASYKAVKAAGRRIGYRHNAIAAQLASLRTNTIGLFLLDIFNEVFSEIYLGAQESLSAAGRKTVLVSGDPGQNITSEAETIENLLSMQVEAAILAGSLMTDEELLSLAKSTELVSVTRLIPGIDSVATDDLNGGRIATEHLISLGHRRIAFLTSPAGPHYRSRADGYLKAMSEAGLTSLEVDGGFTMDSATSSSLQLLQSDSKPTALFAYNDLAALGALNAASELKLAIPEELSVVGYDNTRAANLPGVNLTSVNQHARDLGRIGAGLVIDKLQANSSEWRTQHVLLEPSLVMRESTAKPRAMAL